MLLYLRVSITFHKVTFVNEHGFYCYLWPDAFLFGKANPGRPTDPYDKQNEAQSLN